MLLGGVFPRDGAQRGASLASLILRTWRGGVAESLRRGTRLRHTQLGWTQTWRLWNSQVTLFTHQHLQKNADTHTHTDAVWSLPPSQTRLFCLDSEESLHHHHHHQSVRVSSQTLHPDGHTGVPLISMSKGLHRGASAQQQHAVEDKEEEMWRQSGWQRRRAEKKLLAFWTSLSLRTWTLIRPRDRAGFQRSASAARLLKSEA